MDYSRIRETLGQQKVTTKWCSRCREVRPRADFHGKTPTDLRHADGKQTWCKTCSARAHEEWRRG